MSRSLRERGLKMISQQITKKINFWGIAITLLYIIGLFGPWISLSYDSYAKLNPQTRQGELHYHSTIELAPFFGTVIKDGNIEARIWFISTGTSVSGAIIMIAAVLMAIKFRENWVKIILFFITIFGIVLFFLNLGEGISIGFLTDLGWGLIITLVGLLFSFILSFIEMTKNTVTRHMEV
jgi:hypothetical protein